MKIRIVKANHWYLNYIGKEFDVEERDEGYVVSDNKQIDGNEHLGTVYFIDKDDCEVIEEENKYIKLLKDTYLAYLRFDKALNQIERDKEEVNVAYTWLDSCMSAIFDEIGDEIKEK